ncbi:MULTISPECIES: hypothetical protein [Leuconostoc]|uniref:hypothetical protein n=1 Tax=Leuconostoc TaxID=1243 RepID=UPI003B94F072
MKKLFQFIGAIVTIIVVLLILIPILLVVIGVAVPVVLSIIGIALLFALIIAAIGGIIAMLTMWRFRRDIKNNDFDFEHHGKHYNVHIDKHGASFKNRRDVTEDDDTLS